MSSRTSKASFPPGFCSCPELPAHPSGCTGGLKCVLGRQLALAVPVADVLLPELPFPPPLNTDLDQQSRGKAHFASSVCPLVPECAFPRESCPVIALLCFHTCSWNSWCWCSPTPADGFRSILLGFSVYLEDCSTSSAYRGTKSIVLPLPYWSDPGGPLIYYQGENSWVICCKLRFRACCSPGWGWDCALTLQENFLAHMKEKMGSLPREEPGSSLAGYQAWLVSDSSCRLFSQVSWAASMLEICVRLWMPLSCMFVPLYRDNSPVGVAIQCSIKNRCMTILLVLGVTYVLSLKSTVPGKQAERGIGPQEQWLMWFAGFGKNLFYKISPMVFLNQTILLCRHLRLHMRSLCVKQSLELSPLVWW